MAVRAEVASLREGAVTGRLVRASVLDPALGQERERRGIGGHARAPIQGVVAE